MIKLDAPTLVGIPCFSIAVMEVIKVAPEVEASVIGATYMKSRAVATGAEAAAPFFFGKEPSQLNLASIAGKCTFQSSVS